MLPKGKKILIQDIKFVIHMFRHKHVFIALLLIECLEWVLRNSTNEDQLILHKQYDWYQKEAHKDLKISYLLTFSAVNIQTSWILLSPPLSAVVFVCSFHFIVKVQIKFMQSSMNHGHLAWTLSFLNMTAMASAQRQQKDFCLTSNTFLTHHWLLPRVLHERNSIY